MDGVPYSNTSNYTSESEVFPPPEDCCYKEWTSDDICNPIQKAIDEASEFTIIRIREGTYCNKNFYKNAYGATSLKNSNGVNVENRQNLIIIGDTPKKPKLMIDGWSGFKISNSQFIEISNIEVEGNARRITGEEATNNRIRLTG